MNEAQLEFQVDQGGKTQNEKLRAYLLQRPGVWVEMPALAKVITDTGIGAAVHSRVNDCRNKFAMEIRNKRGKKNGKCISFYMYEPANPAAKN